MEDFTKKLKDFGEVKRSVKMSRFTTFRVGGQVQYFIKVKESDKLVDLLNFLTAEGIDYYLLGGGSNLLWTDEDFEGVVIKNETSKLEIRENMLEVESGVLLGQAVSAAAGAGLSGLEWAIGIPGTIGGAVRGNAGAMGKSMALSVHQVWVWRDGEILELSAEKCNFDYRDSVFKHNSDVILFTILKLFTADKKDIMSQMQVFLEQRLGKHPTHPSAGSFFKNIPLNKWPGQADDLPAIYRERGFVPAGWLIDQTGLTGETSGQAQISPKHGNFIVNLGDASSEEIKKLVAEVKDEVYNKFRVELEEEVQIAP